jgi:capsular polysaccharide biosynthesis protein
MVLSHFCHILWIKLLYRKFNGGINMNALTKKRIMGMVAGGVLLAGTISPFIAQAAEQCNFNPTAMGHHQMDPDKIAQHIADTFGVSKDDVLTYEKQGIRSKDLYKASLLAKASGKSLKEVMQTKTLDNTWKDVAASLGVTKEEIRAAHQDIEATKLERKLNIAKQTSLDLMQQGYRSRDIAVANELSKNTSKPINDILSMRKINNTWYDVAQSLGVDEDTFKQDMKDIAVAFHHRHRGFQGEGF